MKLDGEHKEQLRLHVVGLKKYRHFPKKNRASHLRAKAFDIRLSYQSDIAPFPLELFYNFTAL